MRKPATIESLYLDFDGFFASVMQQAMPELRGRPVGVIPFEVENAQHTVVIACSKEAKALGCSNVMRVPDAQRICPDMVLVMQRPDLFRRAHMALLNEIRCVIPIETVKSIDELCCRLDAKDIADPHVLAARIKSRLATNVGPHVTCSIGMAPNRFLAKIACKMDKPNGVTIWPPELLPKPLLPLAFDDIPGIGHRMAERLEAAGICTVQDLWEAEPKALRKLWGNVNGERFWYALHGYDVKAQPTDRGMFGHARVLPPDWRDMAHAEQCSRLLLTKAARRMRREGYHAGALHLWLDAFEGGWSARQNLPAVNDDKACLDGLKALWARARGATLGKIRIIRVGVTLSELTPSAERQLDMFLRDDAERRRWERVTAAIDGLNRRYGRRVVTLGPWTQPSGGNLGGKISYTRIPSAEDFW